MSDSSYKHGYSSGPFYRKFATGDNVWCEVNVDGRGGLWLHLGNSKEGPAPPSAPIHFDSEEQFMEFCTRLIGLDDLEDFEAFWLKWG